MRNFKWKRDVGRSKGDKIKIENKVKVTGEETGKSLKLKLGKIQQEKKYCLKKWYEIAKTKLLEKVIGKRKKSQKWKV